MTQDGGAPDVFVHDVTGECQSLVERLVGHDAAPLTWEACSSGH
ncbi:hypothetical protein H7J55_14610 [Mycolicibacterium brisbanense]|nr:hypothetical protein [Mycolicibacterium brisbanense]